MPALDSYELNRLSDTLTREYTALVGRKPRGATAAVEDNVLAYSFLNGLSPEEDRLRHQGRRDELRERREEDLGPVGLSLAACVAAATRSEVGFHIELFDPRPGLTTMLFGLVRTVQSQERMIAASVALRGEARRLREESVNTREMTARLRAKVRAMREERHDS